MWITVDVQGALQALETACTLYEALGNRTQSGEMQRMMGRIYWEQADRATALQHYQAALDILEQGPETVELARAISSISQMYMLAAEKEQAIAWGNRALAMAERLGAEDVAVHALNNIGSSIAFGGEYDKGIAMLQESLRRSLAAGLTHDACRAYHNMSEHLHQAGRYAEAYDVAKALYAYATQTYTKIFTYVALWSMALDSWYAGRCAEALSYRSQLAEASSSLNITWIKRLFGTIYLDLGMLEEARRELEATWPNALSANEFQTTGPHLGEMIRLYAALGQAAKANERTVRLLDFTRSLSSVYADVAMPLFYACQWLASQAAPTALEKASQCLTFLERLDGLASTGETRGTLEESRGYVALAQGELQEAGEYFRQAVTHWEGIQRPYDQARALSQLGHALAAIGDANESKSALEQASRIFDAMTAQLDDEMKATFQASPLVYGVRQQLDATPELTSKQAMKEKFGGLTEREREVASLVAQGKSNRDIAAALFLSERTVERHIGNVLSKLAFSSRSQIAVWAVENGLASSLQG